MKNMNKVLAIAAILLLPGIASRAQQWQMQPVGIQTRWAKDVNPDDVLPEYPRPQMVRPEWQNLNGLWEYAITDKDAVAPSKYEGKILVPYPIESALSGVKKALMPNQNLWYKRTISKPDVKNGKRVLLHFGAVDWQATVYVNGKEVGGHTGGYQNFTVDVTDALKSGKNDLVVKVYDPTDQGPNPHGKQVLQPQNIMYTSSSGIWQTVWLETVPDVHISKLKFTPDIDNSQLHLQVMTDGNAQDYTVEAVASNGSSIKGAANTELLLPMANAQLWSPDRPSLYNLSVRLLYKGKVIDTVGSYFGMRKMEIKKDDQGIDRIYLNNTYTYNLGVLDQGFWPEGLYTAPTDAALQFDIMAIRNMGYNTIRKHIKLEPARWYYYADKMGVLVWQDMVTCANGSPEAHAEFEKENKENIEQLYNSPSIVVWVLFNEGWERYDQKRLTEWVKSTDPSRIVDGHTGENYDRGSPQNVSEKWASSDLTDIHDYPGPGIPPSLPGKARVLGEWGGVRVESPMHQWNAANGWGYIQVDASQFARRYSLMLKHLKIYEEEGLSGSIYTEPFDVETEENGMMTYDRELIKIPAEKLREFHRALIPNIEAYAAAPGVFQAKVADTASVKTQFANLYKEYQQGKKDKEFLYDLAVMANKVGDKDAGQRITADYIATMHAPYQAKDLIFLQTVTKSTEDPGFKFIIKNADAIAKVQDIGDQTIGAARGVISATEIRPVLFDKEVKPDPAKLESEIVSKYGKVGQRAVWEDEALYYYIGKDIPNFVAMKVKIHKDFPTAVSDFDANNDAWMVFQQSSDAQLLQHALSWSEKLVQKDPHDAAAIDTYANILYKLGKKDDALSWEQKAVAIDPGNKDIADAYEKMKNGQKTWE
jgi:tetratricopeptide (TPR) repeat protein